MSLAKRPISLHCVTMVFSMLTNPLSACMMHVVIMSEILIVSKRILRYGGNISVYFDKAEIGIIDYKAYCTKDEMICRERFCLRNFNTLPPCIYCLRLVLVSAMTPLLFGNLFNFHSVT